MVTTPVIKTIECPYCGNIIIARISLNLTKLTLSLVFPQVGGGANITLCGDRKHTIVAGYNILCDFCGRKYVYYDFGGKYKTILTMLRFSDTVLYWLKQNGIDLKYLGDIIIGITEPKDKVYQNFLRRLTRKLGRHKLRYKYIEIIFRVYRKECRGVLAGRMKTEPPYVIDVEYYYWSVV